jgi:hypothetical protein
MNRGEEVENDAREIMPFNICTSYHMREIMLIPIGICISYHMAFKSWTLSQPFTLLLCCCL